MAELEVPKKEPLPASKRSSRSRAAAALNRLLMPGLVMAIVVGFYWKLTLTRQYEWVTGGDLSSQVLPWFQEQARDWHRLILPLWDPYLSFGQPLIGQSQPGVAYPLNWVLFALPLHRGSLMWSAVEWYFVVIRMMAAVFCYLLCRSLKRSRPASVLGAVAFTFSGYLATIGWPQMANGSVWLPLVLLFLLRATREKNVAGNAALSGMFLGVAWLSGHHQVPMFVSLAVAGAWLYFIFRSLRPDWRLAKGALIAFVFTGLTGALQILPAVEYGRLAQRWVSAPTPVTWNMAVPYSVHATYDIRGSGLLGLVIPTVVSHTSPYVGVVVLALAFLAVAGCWSRLEVRLLLAFALGGIVYALGHQSVFQGFLYAVVPNLDKSRTPAQAILLFEFGAAVLAAFGLDRLCSSEPFAWVKRVSLGALSFALATFTIFELVYFTNKLAFPGDDRVMITGTIALVLAALLYGRYRGALTGKQAAVLFVLLALFDLGNEPGYVLAGRAEANRMADLNQMRANADIAAFLKKQPGYPRATVAGDLFPANWGAWHGIEMPGGYLASITENVLSLEAYRPEAQQLFGVAYTIAQTPTPAMGQEVFTAKSGLKVYRQPAAFPRAWAVHALRQVRDSDEGNRLIVDHLADLHNSAFMLRRPPSLDSCSGDDVVLQDHRPDRASIRVRMNCTGMVLLSDTYFPGWRAWVDGRPTGIYEVNGAMRGVVAPPGSHVITFRYLPLSVFLGAGLSLAGVCGAVLLARRGRSSGPLEEPGEPVPHASC